MPDLLIELFSEEIPARMQGKAADDLKKLVTNGLVDAGLTYGSAGVFSTPRRLVLTIDGLLAESPEVREERRGPKVGAPEKALEGFLRGAGVAREDLVEREEKKGAFYFATIVKPGRPAADIIAEVLEGAIRNFPWSKSMRWGGAGQPGNGALKWVRPLHSIIALLSDEAGATVVPMDIEGITSGDSTQGHRFMAPGTFSVTGFDDYSTKLKAAHVILEAAERQEIIWQDATNQAFAQGLEVVDDQGLLVEVAGLVEWPVVLMGDIAEDFMELPPEVLQTSMKEHQKFFSVRDPKSGKIVKFITVANRETADNGATILAGNQKVLFARLSDAKFFWENDLRVAKSGMEPWLDSLSNVTFHNKLGSQKERIERIAALARELAPVVGADADLAEQAAHVAKADLSSEMVYEFPELQGLMGRYYATAAGLPADVAEAAEAHYSPLGPSDDVPTSPVSVAVALADKLDLLTGFWAIDEKPTGSKDPFALRRAALGVIRLVLENGVRTSLKSTFSSQNTRVIEGVFQAWVAKFDGMSSFDPVEFSWFTEYLTENLHGVENPTSDDFIRVMSDTFKKAESESGLNELVDKIFIQLIGKRRPGVEVTENLLSFFHDRLKVFLKDQGIRHDVIDACLAMPGNDDLVLLVNRAKALSALLTTDDGENLLQGFKRANNMLSQAEEKDGVEYSYGADVKFAECDVEKALFAALDIAEAKVAPAMEAEDFAAAMGEMAALRAPIDAFAKDVQVNSDNEIIRRNRLNLLSRIRVICLSVADLTKVEG